MKLLDLTPAYEGEKPYLFISYAHKNAESVQPIIRSLFEKKIRVWYDEGIAPGSEWPQNIAQHLKCAAGVIVFVSEHSLQSPNCENEVVNALTLSVPVYQYLLAEKKHPSLEHCPGVTSPDDLYALLTDEKLVGDGIEGYQHGVDKIKKGNFWSSILLLAVVLLLALGAAIYGLNAGWFDRFLPGLAQSETAVQSQSQQVIQTESNAVTEGVFQQTQKALTKTIRFEKAETEAMLKSAIGFEQWSKSSPLTYQDLINCPIEEMILNEANDELLGLLQYFPSLTQVIILDGDTTTLEPLLACAKLQTVMVTYSVLPVTIPENAAFTVEFVNG